MALGQKGYKFGFQSSSDHLSTHISYCVVLAERHDRAAILDGLRKRHCYGATDDIVLEGWARQACAYLDAAYQWIGVRAVAGQPLQWPRVRAVDQDGVLIPADVVPSEIIVAQSLLMVSCAHGPLAGNSGGSDREILSERADDAAVQYLPGSAARRFDQISALIRHLTITHLMGGFRQIMAVRG